MFRVTGRNGESPAQSDEHKNKPPVLYQHGYGGSAAGTAWGGTWNPVMSLRLVDEGYDVWLGNNRGVLYSNVHDRDGEWSLKERWDFSFADMGVFDMPAQLDKVIEVSKKPKVTVIGYS